MFLLICLFNSCTISDTIDGKTLVTKKDLETKEVPSENERKLPVSGYVEIDNVKQENIPLKKSNSNKNETIEKNFDEEKIETSTDSGNANVTIEYVFLDPNNLNLKAKLDSGTKTSSLTAIDIVEFERDGDKWVRFYMINPATNEKIEFEKRIERHVKIRQHSTESQRWPVVTMEVRLGTIHIQREFSLISPNKSIYQAILGRNFMNGVLLMDLSKRFLAIAGSE